ncbi:SGNH/GDSL hydrolase family protein [Sinomonas notoginsengisoli]|uniref:SGNH/GDSL hydrolase family protein n=1 Tax=Sinomonas notoginsengisoli TaxID=1457311 RepID=UPI001F23E756|nr:SGNH/GDSL hydrolase family protein [Sinomonas notoginsengisoli]
MRRPESVALFSGAALMLAAALTGTFLAADQGAAPASAAPAVRVVVVGDSLSTGYGTAAGWAWPHLLSQQEHGRLDVVNASENGDGYLALGEEDGTFGSHAADAVTPETRVVVFFGSENDWGEDPADIADAAVAAVESVRSAAPDARVVMVGPTAFTDEPEPERLAIRDALKSAATRAKAEFVDPLAENWLAGDQFEGADGDHPTVAGQEHLRDEMVRVLGL